MAFFAVAVCPGPKTLRAENYVTMTLTAYVSRSPDGRSIRSSGGSDRASESKGIEEEEGNGAYVCLYVAIDYDYV